MTALGAGGRLVSVLGDDAAGAIVMAMLRENTGIATLLTADPGRQTSVKTRFVAGTQQMMRADREDRRDIEGANPRSRADSAVDLGIADCDVVILSDYGKGVLSRRCHQRSLHFPRPGGRKAGDRRSQGR